MLVLKLLSNKINKNNIYMNIFKDIKYILYYKANISKIELVIQKSFKAFYFDYPRIYIADSYLGHK